MASPQSLPYIINHVFLPPKLPQKDDNDFEQDSALVQECEAALTSFQTYLPAEERWRWAGCAKMLRKILEIRCPRGDMILERLETSLAEMRERDTLAFDVRSQNAGLIVRRSPEQFSFESFELSPTTKSVMTTTGRLQRCFPGPAIAVGLDKMADPSFREALATFLTQLDANTPDEAWPVVVKAQSKAIEVRDTIHPKFVTEMLTGILRGIGQPLDVVRIYKRTRDDVLWDNAFKPWRRSSVWLLLRVALQTSHVADQDERRGYKSFMIFFMARILERALQCPSQSDILFVMHAKISRRVLKLGLRDEVPWMQYVHGTVEATDRELAKRWDKVEQDPDPLGSQQSWSTSKLSFDSDTELSLSNLRPYVDQISACTAVPSNAKDYNPECAPRIDSHSSTFPQAKLCALESSYATRLSLMDLELWVQECLDTWLASSLDSPMACGVLAELIQDYTKVATSAYANNPEDISLMLLTTMDLWVALDKCATHQEPLLKNYQPGFPPLLFDPLLLPKRIQMERLARVENYIQGRRDRSTHSSSLIFQDNDKAPSFAVQYYEQSLHHQQLRREIEAAATLARDRKLEELAEKKEQHRRLIQEANSIAAHDEGTRWNGYESISYHSPSSCTKCRLNNDADDLSITVHEWPLPYIDLEAKSTVFELDVPGVITSWRDITYTLLVDIFSPPRNLECTAKIYLLRDFNGLYSYIQRPVGRLQLASEAKPFVVAHYRSKKLPQATEKNLCVKNGLRYSVYDSTLSQWTSKLLDQCDVRNVCTFQLPPGPYKTLQWCLDTTCHTPNAVLARQAECPRALDQHQFYAFGTMRSGHRLQWRNLARELTIRTLNFSHEETYMLVAQVAWQVGCSDVRPYESHVDLEEEDFGISLLSTLGNALGTVEGNWQGSIAVHTCLTLATRLLSVSPHSIVQNGCYQILRRVREVTLRWARDISTLLRGSQDAEASTALHLRALEVALIGQSTFDVEREHLATLLQSDEDIAVIIECFITIRDRCPATVESLSQFSKIILRRFEKISYCLETELRQRILQDREGIDRTVQRVWVGYRPGSPWTSLNVPNERWLVTQTSAEGGVCSRTVHYNILDGSLLVDGKPLTRLPRSYELHPTYCRVFGEQTLEVVLSTMRGMIFETRNEIEGQQVHFRMHGTELIIRTQSQQQICELVPDHAMRDDFPLAFVRDYAHWLDISTGRLEWRPLKDVWTSSPENWQMQTDGHQRLVLRSGGRKAIDVRSPTARAITQILSPLEHAPHIHISLNCETGALEIHLPRMKLDFILNHAQSLLESKQFRGMVVDERQSFGAFTGLENKLVLRQIDQSSRSVLVPHGTVSFSPQGHHVRVTIDTTSSLHVKYHIYEIDSQLGRLRDNGSLHSRLFKIYLHATTSHCLVDQLTGRTGTEEALHDLASKTTRSFIQLKPEDIELLEKIARLTPRRQFNPKHLQVMQQVDWTSLSPLSQHCEFYKQVVSILDQARSSQTFQEQPVAIPRLNTCGVLCLLERAAIRDSSFQVEGFGAAAFTVTQDVTYHSRDRSIDADRELRTCQTAQLVNNWSTNLTICPQLLLEIESWAQPIYGPGHVELTLGFDPKWLERPVEFLSRYWCTLQDLLSQSVVGTDKYKVMMLLSTFSYSLYAERELILTLLAFATSPELRMLQAPRSHIFQLADGYRPVQNRLACLAVSQAQEFSSCSQCDLPTLAHETNKVAKARRKRLYKASVDEQATIFAQDLISQWPATDMSTPTGPHLSTYIKVQQAMENARPVFDSWHRNVRFQRYIQQVQNILDRLPPEQQDCQLYSFVPPVDSYIPRRTYVSFADLTSTCAPPLPGPDQGRRFDGWVIRGKRGGADQAKLKELVGKVASQCCSTHEQRYADGLATSFEAMRDDDLVELKDVPNLTPLLETHLEQAQRHKRAIYERIRQRLCSGSHHLVRGSRLLPRLSPISILSRLASDKVTTLSDGWKASWVQYGLAITNVQRAERLLAAASNKLELVGELENSGHQNWDPFDRPQWLLFEIENNILIRPQQVSIANETINPSSGSNSVLQFNMGLGKSSVIIPISAVDLADGTQLVRIVVLKPLAMQMFQLLAKLLGGMLNRRIVYMPISRSLDLSVSQGRQTRQIYEECKQSGSILLLQPEHILSFELMGFERLLSGDSELGNVLIETQNWLHAHSRDILDESDEILSVRYELIYTMGLQRAIDFSPERWNIAQHVLGVLGHAADHVLEKYPSGLEVMPAPPGGFPRIRILQTQAGEVILENVAWQLCEDGLPGVPVWRLSERLKLALFAYLTNPRESAKSLQELQDSGFLSESIKSSLLLLKGLFACGILRFALTQKRWRVNFGLDPSRTLLAVPYHAKDSPAARAEFSHPDVTIVLTCLSYYYGGLSDQQIRSSLEVLLQSDHAQEEYERWVEDAPGLPRPFRHITSINLSNARQCSQEVFPPLRFARGVINFYLSAIVFPTEMKEFPSKLSSSGWDIAREKSHPTTGFSGTNDSRYVLPLSINQRDLPAQLSTNAAVLGCLLRPENYSIDIGPTSATGMLDAQVLLEMISSRPQIRVILDVGAQVLELQNEEVARAWLSRVPESKAQAAIFFDRCNEICVLSRDGRKEPLSISPFAQQMDQCLVYLDQSHTRGVDLKLPTDYQAILTLGPGLTKDQLVQACMRMRKLGKGQSVVFCSSMEVQRKIRECSGRTEGPIEVIDILQWNMAETCAYTSRTIPLWAMQGMRHQLRRTVCSSSIATEHAQRLLEPEAQSLQQRYGHDDVCFKDTLFGNVTEETLLGREKQVNEIQLKCREFEVAALGMATCEEEQERELSPENEREQQTELPPPLRPCVHSVHGDVRQLATHGSLSPWSAAFLPAFSTLHNTTANAYYESTAWPRDLLVTADFANTVRATDGQDLDSFLRPVHWIIRCKRGSVVNYVVVSPYEAQELLPLIRQHKQVTLHIYSPRLSLSMPTLEDLSLYAIPAVPESWSAPAISIHLNLFAGQLYIRTYEDYLLLCSFLGLCSRRPENGVEVASDGFMGQAWRAASCPFTTSPLAFVRTMMLLRRKGQSISFSHIGQLLNGELITREQFSRE
ncbi:hypothetical protein HYALB_00002219 [Hymenoscyphus albidus]|uniref:ubiquitinyl hydrolase 1 n=1 Tax=Hymenoscyphus albidus TaxID=595503 RepID=A0A9N9LH49_9HELO|nr:hypothetical protein HYALB_00002219 [Hymenoscyphus albidus]